MDVIVNFYFWADHRGGLNSFLCYFMGVAKFLQGVAKNLIGVAKNLIGVAGVAPRVA